MTRTFLSVVCSFLCLLQAECPRLRCGAVCFMPTLSSTPSTQRNRNMQCRFTQRSLFQLMEITHNDFIVTENAGMVTRMCSWPTGDANHGLPVVSQILGVRKEYRTLGFFKKSCTSLLLERLNICDR